MANLTPLIRWIRRGNDDGATMVEYGIMLALIALVCVSVISTIGRQASSFYLPLIASSL